MKEQHVGPGSETEFFARGKRMTRAADRGEAIPETRIGVFRSVKAEPASVTAIATRLHRDRSAVKRDTCTD
jgi:hypothetical protein